MSAYTGTGLTLKKSADGTKYVVTVDKDTFSAPNFAAYLAGFVTDDTVADATSEEKDGVVTINVDEDGYYLIKSSMGSICQLVTGGSITIQEKNTVPTINKEANGGNASIGDTVTYTLTFTDGDGTTEEAIITDKLPSTLTYMDESLEVKIGGSAATIGTGNAVTEAGEDEGTITVKIDTSKLDKDATVIITYKAVVNDTAEADDPIENEAEMEYSKQPDSSKVDIYTYDFDLKKTDGRETLNNAKFTLYTDSEHKSAVTLVAVEGGYKVADGLDENDETTTTITAGEVNVAGLAAGTYYLVETEAPAGYNLLTSDVVININNEGIVTVDGKEGTVTVVNSAGTSLPTTGGMGRTLIYTVGLILILGCGVTLVVRRRTNAGK